LGEFAKGLLWGYWCMSGSEGLLSKPMFLKITSLYLFQKDTDASRLPALHHNSAITNFFKIWETYLASRSKNQYGFFSFLVSNPMVFLHLELHARMLSVL
jgi:hypothetical protein